MIASMFRTVQHAAGIVALAAFVLLTPAWAQQAPSTQRSVSGIVTDSSHEPLSGAVVEVQNPANHEVISFITAADGHYIFRRLDSHTDFQIRATFRGHKSIGHNISMFDSHLNKIVNIVCRTY